MIVINLTATLTTTQGLESGETIEGKVVPDVGTSAVLYAKAPHAYTYRVIEL